MKMKIQHPPPLDPEFVPAALWRQQYKRLCQKTRECREVTLDCLRPDGSGTSIPLILLPDIENFRMDSLTYLERTLKTMLWLAGGCKVRIHGADPETEKIRDQYAGDGIRKFDGDFFGKKIYGGGFTVESVDSTRKTEAPHEEKTRKLGGNRNGCRIGFDLGGSDRKVAAVIDGEVVFEDETPWNPYYQTDINYHYQGIQDSLQKAANHLPRVDAIGGSAAGVYIDNKARLASLFRGIPEENYRKQVWTLFPRIREAWGNVPFTLVNDGEVSALAGSLNGLQGSVLGISLGTSMAGGYVTRSGHITSWLNELAFIPVDYRRHSAPADEWSGDRGCGVQYFSQQAVARLIEPAGLTIDAKLPDAEKLIFVQERMKAGDEQALKIYQTLGTYLGYLLPLLEEFYKKIDHVLLMGRVTTGAGGEIILEKARDVLKMEFPELSETVNISMPDERLRRLGQAVVAASLPEVP